MLDQEIHDPAAMRRPQQRHELGAAETEFFAGPGGFELVDLGAAGVAGGHGVFHDAFGFVGDDVVLEDVSGGGGERRAD